MLLAVAPGVVSGAQAAPVPAGAGSARHAEPTCVEPVPHVGEGRLGHRRDDLRHYSERQLRSMERQLREALQRRGYAARADRFGLRFRIPVHAHVINAPNTRGPSEQAVLRQIKILNRAYAGGQGPHNTATRFRFYLASLDHTVNRRWYHAAFYGPADRAAKRELRRGGADALNLYFSAPRDHQQGGTVLGYATLPAMSKRFPRLDGVTVHKQSMADGIFRGYNRGDTAVHEVGHWLGLFHTFEGGCSRHNDRVADTPAQRYPSTGCPQGNDTCAAFGRDPVRNFMDYSLDTCMNWFSPGQVERMTDSWLAFRTP